MTLFSHPRIIKKWGGIRENEGQILGCHVTNMNCKAASGYKLELATIRGTLNHKTLKSYMVLIFI